MPMSLMIILLELKIYSTKKMIVITFEILLALENMLDPALTLVDLHLSLDIRTQTIRNATHKTK